MDRSANRAAAAFALIALVGCGGGATSPSDFRTSPREWFRYGKQSQVAPQEFDGALAEADWEHVVGCMKLGGFEPHLFEITLRTAPWACIPNTLCAGQYHPRKGIEVVAGDREAQRHEFIHYVLDVKTGDPDAQHLNWQRWLECQG